MGFPLPGGGQSNLFPSYIDVTTYAKIGSYVAIGAQPADKGDLRFSDNGSVWTWNNAGPEFQLFNWTAGALRVGAGGADTPPSTIYVQSGGDIQLLPATSLPSVLLTNTETQFNLPLAFTVSGTPAASGTVRLANTDQIVGRSTAGVATDIAIAQVNNANRVILGASGYGAVLASSSLGFYNTATPATQQAVTGSRGGNAALASLLTALAATSLIVDNSTA